MKQNRTSDFQRCTTLIQLQCPMLRQSRSNVAQRWYNVVSTLFQRSLLYKAISDPIGPSNDYGFLNRWIVFILLNEEIFLLYINNSTTNKILKFFLTAVHIVIHKSGNNFDKHRSLKYFIQINISYILKKTNLTAEKKAQGTV